MQLLIKLFQHINRKVAVRAVACALIFCISLSICGFSAKCDVIRENVLRLHIIANSDSAEDQSLKFEVRDRLLEVSQIVFGGCDTQADAVKAARENIGVFETEARKVIRESGYNYTVAVEVDDVWFETRDYENFSLPAGTYEALRVIIGEGAGHNWWCVMFPSVCLPAAAKERKSFSKVLSDGECEIVTKPTKYKAQFKIVEVFEKLRKSVY